jgi:large subunit ribosomal protein L31
MKAEIHPKYVDAEIRCACGNVIKTRSTRPVIIVGICNVCHPFYTGQQKFVDTAGRVDKFQQRAAKTQAAQAAMATRKKKKERFRSLRPQARQTGLRALCFHLPIASEIYDLRFMIYDFQTAPRGRSKSSIVNHKS